MIVPLEDLLLQSVEGLFCLNYSNNREIAADIGFNIAS